MKPSPTIISVTNYDSDGPRQTQQLSVHPTSGSGTNTPLTVAVINDDHDISRRPSALLQDILSTRRPSAIMAAIRSPSTLQRPRILR